MKCQLIVVCCLLLSLSACNDNNATRPNPKDATGYNTDPMDAVAYNARATTFYERGEYENAIADLDEAIRLEPKNSKAYFGRGLTAR